MNSSFCAVANGSSRHGFCSFEGCRGYAIISSFRNAPSVTEQSNPDSNEVFMPVPVRQAVKVGAYVFKKRFQKEKRYPLVMMLEPLFRCNLACGGCGKIQYPAEILKKHLSPEECFKAAEECGAPIVTIAGGEPLMHPQIGEIARGMVERKKRHDELVCRDGIFDIAVQGIKAAKAAGFRVTTNTTVFEG